MSWVGLRKAVMANVADSARDRVILMVTRYRKAHDADGRWSLLVDDDELIGMSDAVFRRNERETIAEIIKKTPQSPAVAQQEARRYLRACGQHSVELFLASINEYLNQSIEKSLTSFDAVIRWLAIIDRRVGKRRLARMSDDVVMLTAIDQKLHRLRFSEVRHCEPNS